MFGKTLHRDDRTAAELVAEALKIANQSDVIVAALGESAEMSGESSSRTNLEIHKQERLIARIIKNGETCSVSFIHWSAFSFSSGK
jgi:beta-glucosidase